MKRSFFLWKNCLPFIFDFFVLQLKLLHRNLLLFFRAFYDAQHTHPHTLLNSATHSRRHRPGGWEKGYPKRASRWFSTRFFFVHSRANNFNWSNRCVYITMCPLINNQLIIWYSGLTFAALFLLFFCEFYFSFIECVTFHRFFFPLRLNFSLSLANFHSLFFTNSTP